MLYNLQDFNSDADSSVMYGRREIGRHLVFVWNFRILVICVTFICDWRGGDFAFTVTT